MNSSNKAAKVLQDNSSEVFASSLPFLQFRFLSAVLSLVSQGPNPDMLDYISQNHFLYPESSQAIAVEYAKLNQYIKLAINRGYLDAKQEIKMISASGELIVYTPLTFALLNEANFDFRYAKNLIIRGADPQKVLSLEKDERLFRIAMQNITAPKGIPVGKNELLATFIKTRDENGENFFDKLTIEQREESIIYATPVDSLTHTDQSSSAEEEEVISNLRDFLIEEHGKHSSGIFFAKPSPFNLLIQILTTSITQALIDSIQKQINCANSACNAVHLKDEMERILLEKKQEDRPNTVTCDASIDNLDRSLLSK